MEIAQLIDQLAAEQPLEYKDLPSIPLYMDQVTTLLEGRICPGTEPGEGKHPAKTLINSLTKSGVLPPPEKKKYSREHLLCLLMICKLKAVLNMEDIGLYTNHLLHSTGDSDSLRKFYEEYLLLEKELRTDLYAAVESHYDKLRTNLQVPPADERPALMYALLLANHAAEEKKLAELILRQLQNEA